MGVAGSNPVVRSRSGGSRLPAAERQVTLWVTVAWVADILAGKDEAYWSRVGRERVERELAEDGLSPERIDAVMLTVEGESVPSHDIDLSAVLAALKAREGA